MALNKSVIFIDTEPKTKEKKVEFTHFQTNRGWQKTTDDPSYYKKIFYVGNCKTDGDIFVIRDCGLIMIYKGHLNSGKY